jgi:hypothetical protein
MNQVLMTNIFFIITGVAVIVITIVWVIILIQVIKILGIFRKFEQSLLDEAGAMRKIVMAVRKKVANKVGLGEE